jgi:hypothetical protein
MTTVVVAGALAQRPRNGGHAWVFLNWLLGLRSLGHDVLFIDRLEPGMLDRPDDPVDRSPQWSWLRAVMVAAGFDGQFALLFDGNRQSLGMERSAIVERCRRATVLFNFMGYLDDDEILGAVGTRVFVDLDPGFPQMWHDLGLADSLAGHDAFVTVGLAVGAGSSTVPTCGKQWLTTPPPVDLAAWPAAPEHGGAKTRMTTVATWRGPFAPVEYESKTYGLRVHEHRAYWDLPRMMPGIDCEIALNIDDADRADGALLEAGGWCLVDPDRIADTTERYQRYLYESDAELAVAKAIYVRTRGGWFSDRSACYLASGRPVIAQDTGFSDYLPSSEGLRAFTSPDEAAACAADVAGDLGRHSRAAREVALDHLDAKKVLHSVLSRVGAT